MTPVVSYAWSFGSIENFLLSHYTLCFCANKQHNIKIIDWNVKIILLDIKESQLLGCYNPKFAASGILKSKDFWVKVIKS